MNPKETALEQIETGLTSLVQLAMDQTNPEMRELLSKDIESRIATISFQIQLNPAFLICYVTRATSAPVEFFGCSHGQAVRPNVTVN
jgi:hypothetical protein